MAKLLLLLGRSVLVRFLFLEDRLGVGLVAVRTACVSIHAPMAALVIYHVAKFARGQCAVIAFEQLV